MGNAVCLQEARPRVGGQNKITNMNKNCLIVAEVGNNHEGEKNAAFEMLERAKEAGADLVKFQAGKAGWFARTPEDEQRYMKYELGLPTYRRLVEHGKEIGIPVFFSIWGGDEFDELMADGYRKIASRQCNPGYIEKWDSPKTFISIPNTMSQATVESLGIKESTPLHCVPKYPTIDPELYRIDMLRNILKRPVGYSDHTVGIGVCLLAAERGAAVIEKHFTLAHDFGPLRDHALSATPEELRELVDQIKQ